MPYSLVAKCCAFFTGLIFVCSQLFAASTVDVVENITTVTAPFGKASSIPINLPHLDKNSRISLSPGGPYTKQSITLDSSPSHVTHFNKLTYIVVNKNQINVISWQPIPTIIARYKTENEITALTHNGVFLAAVVSKKGVIWLDFSDTAKPKLVGLLKINGNINSIQMEKNRLSLVENRHSLRIVNFSFSPDKSLAIIEEQILHISQSVNSTALKGDRLFVSGPQLGVAMFALAPKQSPKMTDVFPTPGEAKNLRIAGNLLFLADVSGGLAVFDIADPKHINWLGSHNKLGEIHDVWIGQGHSVSDDSIQGPNNELKYERVVVNNETRLVSLNIANPALPITGSLYKPMGRLGSAFGADNEVFAVVDNTIQRIDFSHDAAVQISNEGINLGGSRRAFIDKKMNLAYVADWFSGLHIYDLSKPRQPRHVGNYHTPGSSKGVVVKDGIAYIGDDDHGLQIVDVSNPSQPHKISEVLSTGLAYTLKLVGSRIYLADHRGGFHIIDVSDIRKPSIIGSFDTPGKSWAIEVRDNMVFVADDLSGLLIFDVSNPVKIKQIGQFNPGGYAEDLAIRDNLAYVTFFDKGLFILDISQPRSPKLVSQLAIPGNARSIILQDDLAYIAGWESGLQIVDISRPKRPQRMGYLDTNGSAWGADVSGHHVYLWDWWGGVKIINVSRPRNPTLIGQYQASANILSLAKQGNYVFTAEGQRGMQVYDIKNPLNPIWVTGTEFNQPSNIINVDNGRAVIALGTHGIVTVDISNPFYAKQLSSLPLAGHITSVAQYQKTIYAASDEGVISIIDASKPDALNPIGSLNVVSNDILVVEKTLLVSSDQGLIRYSLSHPFKPKKLNIYSKNHPFSTIAANKNNIATMAGDNNIHITDHQLKPISIIRNSEIVTDLALRKDRLYIYNDTNGLTEFDITHVDQAKIVTRYPATGRQNRFILHDNTVLFSGDTTLASLSLLPPISINKNNPALLDLPGQLPIGNYHLNLIQANGKTRLFPNALTIAIKKPKKPKLSMDDFKKLLKQHLQNPLPIQNKNSTD